MVDQYENCDSKELYGEAQEPGYVYIRIFTVKIYHCIVKSDHEYTEGISKVPICKCYCFDVADQLQLLFKLAIHSGPLENSFRMSTNFNRNVHVQGTRVGWQEGDTQ